MKLLITGGNGMLGSMLAKIAEEKKYEVLALGREDFDITNETEVYNTLKEIKPDFVVNCAAYTNVEAAEEDFENSNQINGYASGYLAKICRDQTIGFIHISTDYVFSSDPERNGHTEDEVPGDNQPNQYGRSKRLGEVEVMRNNPKSYIIRTQWVFGPNGKNFVDTMINLAQTKDELTIVDDEIGVPCYTKDISNQILYIIDHHKELEPGFYHAVSEGECSRYVQAETIFELIGKKMKLNPIALKDYPRKAKVPSYSVLLNTKLPKLQNWDEAVEEYVKGKM